MVKNEKLLKSIAQDRVARLFDMAKDRTLKLGSNDPLSKRYVGIAKDISTHYRIPADMRMKAEVCKACAAVLIPGMTCSVRLASRVGYLVLRCKCGEEKHIFYRR
jgi:RNase P subunit RPR2